MASEVAISSADVGAKLERLFSIWEEGSSKADSIWHGVDAAVVVTGKTQPEAAQELTNKLVYFQLWLTGFQFPETLMVFTRDKKAFILASAKKIAHLEQVRSCHPGLELLVRSDDNAQFNQIVTHIKTLAAKPVLCKPYADVAKGPVAEQWEQTLGGLGEVRVHETLFSLAMAIRTEAGMRLQKLSCQCCGAVLKAVLINRIEQILDNEEKESHVDIAARADSAMDDKKLLNKWKDKYNIDPRELECVYSNVQSGSRFDLRAAAMPTTAPLSFEEGTIIVSVGTKYSEVPSNLTRTLLLNGKKEVKDMYSFGLEVFKVVVGAIKPGTPFSQVYLAGLEHVAANRPELADKFVRDVGHCLGTEFKDSSLVLTEANTSVTVERGMVFNVSIGFGDLKTSAAKGYAIWIADTVVLPRDPNAQQALVMTENVSRDLEHISYELEDEEPAEAVKAEEPVRVKSEGRKPEKPSAEPPPAVDKKDKKKEKERRKAHKGVSAAVLSNADSIILKDRLRRRDKAGSELEIEERDRRQRELREKKLEEIRLRFQSAKGGTSEKNKKTARKMETISCFDKPEAFPMELRHNKIYVDNRSESVLVPINGTHVPFNVVTLKNVTCNPEEGQKHHTMRINFQVPGSQTLTTKGEDNPLPDLQSPNALFIKELLYRSEDGKHLQAIHRAIKELIKRVKQSETEADVARDLADQAHLQINRTARRVMLKDLLVRPNLQTSRKVMGSLEAHTNGFRFQVNNRVGQMDHVDITYANVKHAIFQPCERELIVLIHFHLKSPIMVGKKKTQDVQFYCEAGTQTDDLDVRRRNYHDPDETLEESRDREIRRRLNNAFKGFVQQVEEMSGLEFDVPYRELMFYGVPMRSTAEILPTANCLVHLVEWPPFVLPLEDIEIVSFERVQHGLRNFDMVFVFQDYAKPTRQVTSIPTEYLDNLKRWLNELEIVWYENKNNLSWQLVMKTIREDVEGFIDLGGFESVLGDGTVKLKTGEHELPSVPGGEEDSDEDDEDDEYQGDDDDSEQEESSGEEDDSDDESLAEESEDESYQDMDSDEEEGLSWDELEERAKRDDRKRTYETEEADSRHRKSSKKR